MENIIAELIPDFPNRRYSFIDTAIFVLYFLRKGGGDMPNGTIRINKDLRYFRKDHFCPNCRKQLNKVSVSKVVNSHSPEAKDYPFHMCRTNIVGDVLFTWEEFECPSCNTHFTVDEIKASEGIAVRAPKSKVPKWLWYAIALLVFLVFCLLKNGNII